MLSRTFDSSIALGQRPGRQFRIPKRVVISKRGMSRKEYAISPPAESRFPADKPGFGMTRAGVAPGGKLSFSPTTAAGRLNPNAFSFSQAHIKFTGQSFHRAVFPNY